MRPMKRSVLVRCLVVLLALALSCGSAYVPLRLISADQPVSHAQHQHDNADHSGHQPKPQQDRGLACCCDDLRCMSAYTVTPNPGAVAPAIFGIAVLYGRRALVLHGHDLQPERKPPRPASLK